MIKKIDGVPTVVEFTFSRKETDNKHINKYMNEIIQ